MRAEPKRTGGLLRRFGVFVLGAVLGAALLWCSAFAGITLGFSGAGGEHGLHESALGGD